jgi:hypothetical protein
VIADRAQCVGHCCSASDAVSWELLRDQLHEYRFWEQLDPLQRFLKPYLEVTIALESNCLRALRIYAYFNYLLEMSTPASLPRAEILTIITKRWLSLAHPLFTVAYICDLAARDDRKVGIPNRTRDEMANWLLTRFSEEGVAALILRELFDCWGRRGMFSNRIVWESFCSYSDPGDWWLEQECSDELKALAIYALSVNPTTGAAERNWSIHSYLYSKARNRLTNERVQKLVYLFQNL